MTRIPAPGQPPATWHAGRRPIPAPPARTYGQKSKPGRNRVPASRRPGNSASPAPLPGQNRPEAVTHSVRQHPTLTGATRSSARPVSPDPPARAGPTIPPCATRPNLAALPLDLSWVNDLGQRPGEPVVAEVTGMQSALDSPLGRLARGYLKAVAESALTPVTQGSTAGGR